MQVIEPIVSLNSTRYPSPGHADSGHVGTDPRCGSDTQEQSPELCDQLSVYNDDHSF